MADENYSYAPKYVQIQNYILQKIESGEYTAGDKIPSEIELARQFDVSRLTVNTAVKELANSGIVERVQGKGTFVRFVPGQSFSSPMAFSGGITLLSFLAGATRERFFFCSSLRSSLSLSAATFFVAPAIACSSSIL